MQQFSLEHNRHHCSKGKRIFIAILPYINLCFLHVYNYICGCPSITDLFLHNLPSFIIRLVKSEVFSANTFRIQNFFLIKVAVDTQIDYAYIRELKRIYIQICTISLVNIFTQIYMYMKLHKKIVLYYHINPKNSIPISVSLVD